jgi:hypothetical protein
MTTTKSPPTQAAQIKSMTTHKPRRLTDAFIKALPAAKAGQRYAVSDQIISSLRVRVTDTGHKSYILWRRTDPRAKSASALALGTVGQLTLADARTKARRWLGMLAEGVDPREVERETRANTVAAASEKFIAERLPGQRNAARAEKEIRREIISRWKNKSLVAVSRQHLLAATDEIKALRCQPASPRHLGALPKIFQLVCPKGLPATQSMRSCKSEGALRRQRRHGIACLTTPKFGRCGMLPKRLVIRWGRS